MEFLSSPIAHMRVACVDFPDERRGDVRYSMADIGLSAFSLFFMQSASFLSYQRALDEDRKTSNCRTLLGMTRADDEHPTALRHLDGRDQVTFTRVRSRWHCSALTLKA